MPIVCEEKVLALVRSFTELQTVYQQQIRTHHATPFDITLKKQTEETLIAILKKIVDLE
jgi:hypothetical protein